MPYLQHRYTEVRLTSCTRRQASSSVSRIESSSGGEMPALLNSTSSPPNRSIAAAYIAWTSSGSVTSARTNSPPTSSACALPPASSRSATTTCAPSAANRRALARPMPLAAPVMTATLPSSLPAMPCLSVRSSSVRCEEDVLHVGERVQRIGPELAAEPRLLHPAERRPVPHRRVGVHRQVAGLDRPGHTERPPQVLGPDRAGQPVLGVVGQPDRLGLVVERDDGDHRAEDLLPPGGRRRVHGR